MSIKDLDNKELQQTINDFKNGKISVGEFLNYFNSGNLDGLSDEDTFEKDF